jgi:hypothetical protein
VMTYVRYPLSLRDVEDLLTERPVLVEQIWSDVRSHKPTISLIRSGISSRGPSTTKGASRWRSGGNSRRRSSPKECISRHVSTNRRYSDIAGLPDLEGRPKIQTLLKRVFLLAIGALHRHHYGTAHKISYSPFFDGIYSLPAFASFSAV